MDTTVNPEPVPDFGTIAERLARNPLGIIALFIVLVYGLAAIVTAAGGSLSTSERLPLIYFMVVFPVLVLVVFAWLVSKHSAKLFAPSDFRDEDNYVRTLSATASLAAASVSKASDAAQPDIASVVATVRAAAPRTKSVHRGKRGRAHVLWVDDNPDDNVNERHALEHMGLTISLARSTAEALEMVSSTSFAAIISDMGRPDESQAGRALLEALRRAGQDTPFFVYGAIDAPELRHEIQELGGQGLTSSPQELFRLVMQAV